MATAPKRPKQKGVMRQLLAQNVTLLMERMFDRSPNKPKALAKMAGVSFSTVQRVLAGSHGASIDTIEVLANVFELSAYQLVLPNLDPANPQVVTGATAAERALYASFKRGQIKLERDARAKTGSEH